MNPTIRNYLLLIFISILFFACGSRSSDFSGPGQIDNPLPPCPDSPNCVRITKTYPDSIDAVWDVMLSVFQKMKPYDVKITGDLYRIDTVFLVTFFKDDMVVKLEEADSATHVHIRSSSRMGFRDFGVNRRRVKRFLMLMGGS